MAEKIIEHVIADLREIMGTRYPHRGELGKLRLLRHTPKKDYIAYDLCADFGDGTERLVAKVYRPDRCRGIAKSIAQIETANLQHVHRIIRSKKLSGVPCLLGNFSEQCVVVTSKICGLPLQPMIMKAALLPEYADGKSLALAASRAGKWLRSFHRATADLPEPFDGDGLMSHLVMLCEDCRAQGLDLASVRLILERAQRVLSHCSKALPSSAVLSNFTPLNVIVTGESAGFSDFSKMKYRGNSLEDVAMFMAAADFLEKYPFCTRRIVSQIREGFLDAYGIVASSVGTVDVLTMKIFLEMLMQGRRGGTGTAKNAMWSNVTRNLIHQFVQRPLAPIAA